MGHSPPHHFKFNWKYNKFTWQRTVCVARHETANHFGTSWTFPLQRSLHWLKKYLCVLLRQIFREKYSDLHEKRFFFLLYFFLQEELTPRILWVWKNYDGREICELLKIKVETLWGVLEDSQIPGFQSSSRSWEDTDSRTRVLGWEQKVDSLNLTSGQLNFWAVKLPDSWIEKINEVFFINLTHFIQLFFFYEFSTNFQRIEVTLFKKTFYTRPFTSYIKDSWFLSRDSWWAGLSQLSRDRNLKCII